MRTGGASYVRGPRRPVAEGGILDSTEIEIELYGLEEPSADDGRLEPLFAPAPIMIGFEEPGQPVLDNEPLVDGTTRFQPELLDVDNAQEEPEEPFPEPLPISRLAVGGAVLVYALVFLTLLVWPETPMGLSEPIPVQLVIETPQPQQQAQAQAQQQPPPPTPQEQIRRSSDDSGSVTPTPKPEESKAAESAPPPLPEKSPTEQAPPPKPLPAFQQQEAAAIPPPPPPKPTPPPPKAVVHVAAKPATPLSPRQPEEISHAPARRAAYEGPPATRDEYLATLVRLTKQHINLLTPALGERRGETRVGVRVLGDGTIANVAVVESSGYPDIDDRIEKMVLAVGRFPPLPQWFQGSEMQLELRLRFPEALRD
jgi:TonB family protein